MDSKFKPLLRRLHYEFQSPRLLKEALTHRSVGKMHNERLEFLGDSVLNFIITQALFSQFQEKTEGELSRLRAHLVKGEQLADIAKEINLGDFILLGPGELRSGGFRRTSILADSLEAVLAAIYLDGGLEAAKSTILTLYQTRLNDDALTLNLKDPKTQLQEYLQAEKHPLPEYTLDNTEGEGHEQVFFVTCLLKTLHKKAQGQGLTRRAAEQEAAKSLLIQLKLD